MEHSEIKSNTFWRLTFCLLSMFLIVGRVTLEYMRLYPVEHSNFFISLTIKAISWGIATYIILNLKRYLRTVLMFLIITGAFSFSLFYRDNSVLITSFIIAVLISYELLKNEKTEPSTNLLIVLPLILLWVEDSGQHVVLLTSITIFIFFFLFSYLFQDKSPIKTIMKSFIVVNLILAFGFYGWNQLIPLYQQKNQKNTNSEISMNDQTASEDNYQLKFSAQFKRPLPEPNLMYWHQIIYYQNQKILIPENGFVFKLIQPKLNNLNKIKTENNLEKYKMQNIRMDHIITMPFLSFNDNPIRIGDSYGFEYKNLYDYKTDLDLSAPNIIKFKKTITIDANIIPEQKRILPRVQTMVDDWRKQGFNDQQIVQEVLHFLKTEFQYTRTQQKYNANDEVEDFLFQNRKGACTQFTMGFMQFMNAANIEATPVSGYLGSELNPYNGNYEVYGKDAHVWTYVKLNGTYRLIDPTVAPNIDPPPSQFMKFMNQISQRFRAFSTNENNIINMGKEQLEAYKNNKYFILISIIIFSLILIGFLYYYFRKKQKKANNSEIIITWQKIEKKLRQSGYSTTDKMSAKEILTSIKSENVEIYEELKPIVINTYLILYQNRDELINQTIKDIKKIKIRRKRQ